MVNTNNVIAYGPDGNVISLQKTSLGVEQMVLWLQDFYLISRNGWVTTRSVSTRGFLKWVQLSINWLEHLISIVQDKCTLVCAIICCVLAIFTNSSNMPVSGVCKESPQKNVCLLKVVRKGCLGFNCINSHLLYWYWVDLLSDQNCFWSWICTKCELW